MYKINPLSKVQAVINLPPDKSISHRALIISSIALGETIIEPFLGGDDALATFECMKRLGVEIKRVKRTLIVSGGGKYFPKKRLVKLFARESGTTLRTLSGILCGQRFPVVFDAGVSLRKRPMARITAPLRRMGASIEGVRRCDNEYPPLTIKPVARLNSISYALPVASAQVKTALMYAALYTEERTTISEPLLSRDHTERMFSFFNISVVRRGKNIIVTPPATSVITPGRLFVPGDFSSAAFFIVLALILPDSEILLKDVNINPTRCGFLRVLKRMGARISIINSKDYFEPYADILVKSSQLQGTVVSAEEVPLMVDEIPILCVAASFARGTTTIEGVGELKIKETDRVESMIYNLRKAGVISSAREIEKYGKRDWIMEVTGARSLRKGQFKSFADHRTAMSMIVLSKASDCENTIDDIECINKSFPQFVSFMESLHCHSNRCKVRGR